MLPRDTRPPKKASARCCWSASFLVCGQDLKRDEDAADSIKQIPGCREISRGIFSRTSQSSDYRPKVTIFDQEQGTCRELAGNFARTKIEYPPVAARAGTRVCSGRAALEMRLRVCNDLPGRTESAEEQFKG